jgi:hypothetical protein
MKKRVHIVVKDGLIQSIFAENVEIEAVIYDLDTDDNDEYDELCRALDDLRKTNTECIY